MQCGGRWQQRPLFSCHKELPRSENRTGFAMNSALIAIGLRPAPEQQAIDAAARIGRVIVQHGDTNGMTSDSAGSIRKAKEREVRRAQPAKSSA